MKKSVLFFTAIFFLFSVSLQAQQVLSKEGRPVLPERGDWGLGIDVTRMVSFAGLRLSTPSQLISFKHMADSARAYRLGLRLGFNNTVTRNRTINRAAAAGSVQAYPAAMEMKDNVWQRTSWMAGLSFGQEKRRGSRLQGLYGFEGILMLSSSTDKFRYGNALDASPLGRISVDEQGDAMSNPELGGASNIDTLPMIQGVTGSARVLQRKNGLTAAVGLRVFAGAEYFFLPKMSIGAELGWGIGFSTTGRSETVLESEGSSTVPGSTGPAIRQTTVDGDASTSFSAGHDVINPVSGMSASIRFHLYF